MERQPVQGIGTQGFARLEYGPDIYDLTCDVCGATWCGIPGDECGWCERSLGRLVEDERRALLYPTWLTEHGPTYDELGDIDKRVWRATRGWSEEGSMITWVARLRRATDVGLVTETEAVAAVQRAAR